MYDISSLRVKKVFKVVVVDNLLVISVITRQNQMPQCKVLDK